MQQVQVTERELMDIEERLRSHAGTIEKLGIYIQNCQDGQLRDVLSRQQGVYQRHYQQLLGFVQPGAQGTQGTTPIQ